MKEGRCKKLCISLFSYHRPFSDYVIFSFVLYAFCAFYHSPLKSEISYTVLYLFKVILTDNGVEFKDPLSLEHTSNGCQRTRIFYCDPQASWQKPHIEKNHTLIRRILPKGKSFDYLTHEDIRLICCHINSFSAAQQQDIRKTVSFADPRTRTTGQGNT